MQASFDCCRVQVCPAARTAERQNRGRVFSVQAIYRCQRFHDVRDVMQACKKRLARHAATYLETMDFLLVERNVHTCIGSAVEAEVGLFIEECVG